MTYQITFENQALKDIDYFKKHNKDIIKKIHSLLLEITESPFVGTGKPELLKFEPSGYWLRRISAEHRLIYRVLKKQVIVVSCKYYY